MSSMSSMMPSNFGPPQGLVPMYMAPIYQQQHQPEIQPLNRYGGDTSRSSPSHDPRLAADDVPPSNDVQLSIRQQPKEALVTIDGKEKARKPVDPPPIIQLKVKQHADPQGHYMQSPYLIMIADLWHPEKNEANPEKALAGTICSSLHRLKDVDNKDGAFFVFGDISIKQQGEHRLRFSLFDIHKPGNMYQYVTHIISEKFKVVSQKDFHGMDESTYLSRAFSDQGVRLRLRKEPRHVMGRKRSPQSAFGEPPTYPPPTPTAQTALSYPMSGAGYQPGGYPDHHDDSPAGKRSRFSGGNDEDSSPRYGQVASSPSSALAHRAGNLPVQSPGVPSSFQNWNSSSGMSYGGNYSMGRSMGLQGMNTSGAGEFSSMAPPPLSASMPFRAGFPPTSGAGLPSFPSRNALGGLEGFQDDSFGLSAYHHDRQSDSHSSGSNQVDYSTHTPEHIRGMPVQSPEQSLPRTDFNYQSSVQPSLQPSPMLNTYGSSANRSGGMQAGSWPVPIGRYEERCDRARTQYQLNPLHSPMGGGSDGHHASSQHGASYDDHQYKQEDHHFKNESQ